MQDSTLESSSAVFVRIGAAVGLHASTRRVSLYCPEPVTVLQISVQAMKNVIDGSFIDRFVTLGRLCVRVCVSVMVPSFS
jgi:hypothetical protein